MEAVPQQIRAGNKRVARLMRESGPVANRATRFRVSTQSAHRHPIAPNVLARRFALAQPNRVWSADITYVFTGEGWLYQAVMFDVGTRRVVGWALRCTLDRALVVSALRQALAARQPLRLLHHSDRGSQ